VKNLKRFTSQKGTSVSNDVIHQTSNKYAKKTDEDALAELLELLGQADLSSPLAALNATTISDNNGGRIEL
jgi:hypothetical protein